MEGAATPPVATPVQPAYGSTAQITLEYERLLSRHCAYPDPDDGKKRNMYAPAPGARSLRLVGLTLCLAVALVAICSFLRDEMMNVVMAPPMPHLNASQIQAAESNGGPDALIQDVMDPKTSSFLALEESEASEDLTTVTLLTHNSYTQDDPVTVYPWENVVEPHRETYLETSNMSAGLSVSEHMRWSFEGDASTVLTGSTVTYTFTKVGSTEVYVTVPKDDGTTVRLTGTVMCKYVRREIRALTDDDREAFLTALHTVYSVSTNDGLAKGYGKKYKDITYFAQLHLAGAADRECDHWHDGSGLMVHHMSFTLELEQTLQAVDPSVAVPYWDYSIDAYVYGGGWEDSVIFDPLWFGPHGTGATKVVSEGRWAYTPLARATATDDGTSMMQNPYGLMRSPWNLNPTPFLTRWHSVFNYTGAGYTTFPDCAAMHSCFLSDSLSDMNVCLNGDTHGPVHTMIGGQWHESVSQKRVVHHYLSERMHLLVFKLLWRQGFASCPSVCGDDDAEACVCSCPDDVVAKSSPYDILKDSGALHWIDSVSDELYWDADEGKYKLMNIENKLEDYSWHSMLQGYCNPGFVGELYTSNAPYDPLFWPIHTTAERLLSYRRILDHMGNYAFNQTWGYTHPAATPSDTGMVCDWSAVTGDGTGSQMPSCSFKECLGHGPDDILPSGNFMDQGETYTNMEFYEFMDPYNEDLPYIYDNFEFPTCDSEGFRMSSSLIVDDADFFSFEDDDHHSFSNTDPPAGQAGASTTDGPDPSQAGEGGRNGKTPGGESRRLR